MRVSIQLVLAILLQSSLFFAYESEKNQWNFLDSQNNQEKFYSLPLTYKTQDIATWVDRSLQTNTSYRVSLVGVNINTWLENPQYFTDLRSQARKFPINQLLQNLKTHNPELIFTDHSIVVRSLKKDIYSQYLKTPLQKNIIPFSDVQDIISYTRRYHIYGSAAGELPYFGRPMEGMKRAINLGLISGQFQEIAVKLPDTDVFLVAMLNIIPNWLEEGLDVFQVNQQELEILVYAFDRQGKLIGGAGVPMSFIHAGQTTVIEQKLKSPFWQPGISRQFYILPSFQIVNTRDQSQAKSKPNIAVPAIYTPLNGDQKYILNALTYLQNNQQSTSIELFDEQGKKTIAPKKTKSPKIVLKNKFLKHPESVFVQNKSEKLSSLDINVRLKKIENSEDEKLSQTITQKEYYPSNEGKKLVEFINYSVQMLNKPIFSRTNELVFTNSVLPYELEMDPVLYAKKLKQYHRIPYNINEYKKDYNKETKKIRQQDRLKYVDKLHLEKFRFEFVRKHSSNFNEEISVSYHEWRTNFIAQEEMKKNLVPLQRKARLYGQLTNQLPEFERRNYYLIQQKYGTFPEKNTNQLNRLKLLVEKSMSNITLLDSLELQEQTAALVKELQKQEKETSRLYDKYQKVLFQDVNIELLTDSMESLQTSPAIRYRKRRERKERWNAKKKVMTLRYEGFELGLTSVWSTKVHLEDRLHNL